MKMGSYGECYCQMEKNDSITAMDYLGNGKYKCPLCGDEEDRHEIIYQMRLEFTIKDGCIEIAILEPFDPRLNNKYGDWDTLKEAIEEEFHESEFEEKHEVGVFDVDLLFNTYCLADESGTEYYLDCEIVKETKTISFFS